MRNPPRPRAPHAQRGVALYVALIVLLAMTSIGIALYTNNGLQSRMAYGAAESQFAFNSAETALAAGEDWIALQSKRPIASCTAPCAESAGIWRRYGEPSPVITSTVFTNEDWWLANGRQYGYRYAEGVTPTVLVGQTIERTKKPPRYVIEDLGADPAGSLVVGQGVSSSIHYFQVTARGLGAQEESKTLVQSVYAKGF